MTISEAVEYYSETNPRGEYVLIVAGADKDSAEPEDSWWSGLDIKSHVEEYINRGMDSKEAVKTAAKDRNIPKREVYNEYHK